VFLVWTALHLRRRQSATSRNSKQPFPCGLMKLKGARLSCPFLFFLLSFFCMFKKIKIIIQVVVIVLIAGGLGYYFYSEYQKSQIPENPKAKIIRQITTLTFVRQDLDEEKKAEYQEKFENRAKIFFNNPEGIQAFRPLIGMAQIKELVGDYQGAEQALIWAVDLQPKSYLAHGNLANLYFRHFQDFAKAEEHFLKAIEPDDPKTIHYYFDLHEIYRYFYKQDTTLAEDILKQGIEQYPESTDLMAVLAHYYRDLGRKREAKECYLKILEINPDSQVAKQGLIDLEE